MRTLTFGMNVGGEVYRASVTLPDEYFDDRGLPKWHLLNNRFSSPVIYWDRPIGAIRHDEVVVVDNPQPLPIKEELQKLRDVVVSLERKFEELKP